MDKQKDYSALKNGLSISIVITILFTCGFILGALTAHVRSMATDTVVETTEAVTTTQVTTTAAPVTTTAPTTQAPTTVVTTTEETTTEETTTEETTTEESTTEPTTEETTTEPAEEDNCCLVDLFIKFLEFCKQIIDFIISAVSSLF